MHKSIELLNITGQMSGTSLDGIDFANCTFHELNSSKLSYTLHAAETYEYPEVWKEKLQSAPTLSGLELTKLSIEYGKLIGEFALDFHTKNQLKPHYLSIHGYTVFHQPNQQIGLQIGHGAYCAQAAKLPVICDFRSSDIAASGQGAPLVPIGDSMLFSEFDACLNLGGFSNISFFSGGPQRGFDICPCNLPLNHLSLELANLPYDKNGELGKAGTINQTLLHELNQLAYYSLPNSGKSLGTEWLNQYFFPLLQGYTNAIPTPNILRTVYEHIAHQIASVINKHQPEKVLVTGGGAHNEFLMEEILQKITSTQLVIPEADLINFKEAIVFALLGWLRVHQKNNILKSYTNAVENSTAGAVYWYSQNQNY